MLGLEDRLHYRFGPGMLIGSYIIIGIKSILYFGHRNL